MSRIILNDDERLKAKAALKAMEEAMAKMAEQTNAQLYEMDAEANVRKLRESVLGVSEEPKLGGLLAALEGEK